VAETREVQVGQLKPGDRLARDVIVQSSVLLRGGSVLTEANIARIKHLEILTVLVDVSSSEPAVEPAVATTVVEIELPDFSQLTSADRPGWLGKAEFHQPVQLDRQQTPEEQLFAAKKDEIRAAAGLKPLIEEKTETKLTRSVHAAFVSSATKGKVDLERLDSITTDLSAALGVVRDGYIAFTDTPDYLPFSDAGRYGEVLAARTMMSTKLYTYAQPPDSTLPAREQLRAHLALCNGHALMPVDALIAGASTDDQREQARQALLDYYGWLRSQRFVSESILEQLLLRYERHDGRGLPYGLQGEMIPAASQSWSMVWRYSAGLFSKPNQERLSPHAAGDMLVRESDKAVSSASVNGFLKRLGYYPIGTPVKLNDGRMALVTGQNSQALLKPRVRLLDGRGGVGDELNLVEEEQLFISDAVLEF